MDLSKEKYIVPTDSHCRNGHHLSFGLVCGASNSQFTSCVAALGHVSQCSRCQEQFCQCSVIGMAMGISLGCSLRTPWSSASSGVDGFHWLPFGDSRSWCSVSLATGNWFIEGNLAWWLEGSWHVAEREGQRERTKGRKTLIDYAKLIKTIQLFVISGMSIHSRIHPRVSENRLQSILSSLFGTPCRVQRPPGGP